MDGYKRSSGFGGDRGGRGGFNRGGGRPSFGGRSDFRNGGRDGEKKEMFDALCANCHKSCKIPFRPMSDKPVYCSDCFGARQGDAPRGNFDRRNDRNSRPSFDKKDFVPTSSAKTQMDDRKIDDIKKQLEIITTKLDTLIKVLNKDVVSTPVVEKKIKPEEKKKKTISLKSIVKKVVSKGKK